MRLFIKEEQRPGRGVVFALACKLELTPEEQNLVSKYEMGEYPIGHVQVSSGSAQVTQLREILRGYSTEMRNFGIMMETEASIIESCKRLKAALEARAAFGGEAVIDI